MQLYYRGDKKRLQEDFVKDLPKTLKILDSSNGYSIQMISLLEEEVRSQPQEVRESGNEVIYKKLSRLGKHRYTSLYNEIFHPEKNNRRL